MISRRKSGDSGDRGRRVGVESAVNSRDIRVTPPRRFDSSIPHLSRRKAAGKVNITLKSSMLRGWKIINETKKYLIIEKTFIMRYNHRDITVTNSVTNYLPKKSILKIESAALNGEKTK
jgi:hypothetical protein